MFRIITERVKKPNFLVICDNPHCGEYLTYPVTEGVAEDEAVAAFCVAIQQPNIGWQIKLDRQYCKYHRVANVIVPGLIKPAGAIRIDDASCFRKQ